MPASTAAVKDQTSHTVVGEQCLFPVTVAQTGEHIDEHCHNDHGNTQGNGSHQQGVDGFTVHDLHRLAGQTQHIGVEGIKHMFQAEYRAIDGAEDGSGDTDPLENLAEVHLLDPIQEESQSGDDPDPVPGRRT